MINGERLFAFLDDVFVTTTPNRVGAVHSRIHINIGKTQVWNAAGIWPPACDELERIAQLTDPDARVWKGSGLPTSEQGVRILGTPEGHPDFVQAFLRKVLEEHDVLLSRQSAWALLLHCAGGRANYMLRVVRPEAVQTFAEGHSDGLWSCLRNILGVTLDTNPSVRDIATMLLSLGGMGLRNAVRTSPAAFWASWADCLSMVRERHPEIATTILRRMGDPMAPPTLVAARTVAGQLVGVAGFDPPSWEALADGQRPPLRDPDDSEPGDFRHGWQHEASSRVERQHREILLPQLTDSERAMLRSHSGPLAGVPFSTTPSSFLSRIDSHFFRVLLLRRLCLPLPLSLSLHVSVVVAVLSTPLATELHVLERGCWEGGASQWRVQVFGSAVKLEEGLLLMPCCVSSTLEILVDGLPLFGGAQLAVDTTLVSPLHCDGSLHPRDANEDGAVLAAARRLKERTYPELVGPRRRARLVVLAGEIGGRWSEETRRFLSLLAKAKARSPILKRRAEQAWRMRWGAILSCAAARAFAASLLELKHGGGVDGDVLSTHDVVNDFHHTGLS